jgi:hypothetical protein
MVPLQNVITVDDIDLIIAAVSDALEDILQRSEAKHETMFDRIEAELKGVQHDIYSSHAISTEPLLAGDIEVGHEPT